MYQETDLNTKRNKLSHAKRALLEKRLEQARSGSAQYAIPRRNKDDSRLPPSFAQNRLWFLDRWEPGSTQYNDPVALRLKGPLNFHALRMSLNLVICRHEALRTTFADLDGRPEQRIALPSETDLPVEDLTQLPDDDRESALRHLLYVESLRPFDLARGPLLRAALFCLGDEEHVLMVVMHHIVTDGWSRKIFFRELSIHYSAYLRGTPSLLPELPVQYADFSIWQRRRLEGELTERELGYWEKQLHGIKTLELPTDRPRAPVKTYCGAKKHSLFPRFLAESLRELSRREGVTLFMILLAVFQTLLHRYTGEDDIAVGSPIANRIRTEIEGLIGFFVNTLVLRTDLGGNPTFWELLGRVRETALGAYAHQEIPFEKLVEELNPERSLSHTPLFQVMLVLQNAPGEAPVFYGITAEPLEIDTGTAKFDLSLSFTETAEGIRGAWEYNPDLFDGSTIERMIVHFRTLLEGIVANPERRISELPLLTEAERRQLLVEWNDTKADYPHERCIHELFEEQVEQTPEAVALVFEDREMTYRELNARSNRLAHYLRKLGVGPEEMVGICVERSPEMVVGILGILKAGGAYLPLDPKYPREKLALMIEDARTPVILTHRRLRELLPHRGAELVCLDSDWPVISREVQSSPASGATFANLAYITYTSGSTGKPKGVEVTHRGVVRLLFGNDYTLFDEHQTFLHLSPINFDASTFEIWGALLHGARCILYPGRIPTTDILRKVIREHRVSTLWLTSSLFNAIVDEAPQALQGVSRILAGGEQLSPDHICRALKHLPDVSLINGYGPTESTTFTSCYAIPKEWCAGSAVPIGRPIANTRVYILDSRLNPVPIGVAGELYIGGDGLARGYLNRPELTEEKFIPDPFSDEPGARLYRTGDLARYLPDGNIEFLGRMDHQVKIHGFRIEPGEIEVVLGQHSGVWETVVLAREDISGDKRLIAYVVPEAGSPPTTAELRRFLAEKIPDYMIPSHFVMLESLPLTPSGKVDRRALPLPDNARPEMEESFIAPRATVEQAMAGIWADLLHLERVGLHDNFFELGGHSLMAVQIVSRVRNKFHIEIPLRHFFETPSIAGLAALLAKSSDWNQETAWINSLLTDLDSLTEEEVERQLNE